MIQSVNGFLQKERLRRLQESVLLGVVASILLIDMTPMQDPSLLKQTGPSNVLIVKWLNYDGAKQLKS